MKFCEPLNNTIIGYVMECGFPVILVIAFIVAIVGFIALMTGLIDDI